MNATEPPTQRRSDNSSWSRPIPTSSRLSTPLPASSPATPAPPSRRTARILRGWISWLDAAFLDPFVVEHAHIELYARWSEAEGKARSTIGRRLSTICGFYKYCAQERLIERDPSAHVRRPKQDYESSTLGLDRNELGSVPGPSRTLRRPATMHSRVCWR